MWYFIWILVALLAVYIGRRAAELADS